MKNNIRESIIEFMTEYGYKFENGMGIISPYFTEEFNLSAGHQFVIPVLNNPDKVDVRKLSTIEWCIRRDDISRIGYTNMHLACFEMVVVGRFGYIADRKKEQIQLFHELVTLLHSIGLDKKKIYFTITRGAKVLDVDFEFDQLSYNALLETNISDSNIIITNGRQNIVFSNGENRASGYNVEIYYLYRNKFVEIASANIYEYILKNNKLFKTANSGLGFGLGVERINMVANKLSSVYDTDYYLKRLKKLHEQIPNKKNRLLIYQKLLTIIELNKTIEHINKQIGNEFKTINKKQKKAYNYIKAKLESELRYLQINNSIEHIIL